MTRGPHSARRRGVAAIEFALTVPFLLAVVLGVVEFSLLMHRTHLMHRASLDACRTGASVLEGVTPTGDQIEAAAIAEARFSLGAAGIPCGVDCVIQADWHRVNRKWMMLTVNIDVPYAGVTGLVPRLPATTHGEFTMLTQQQKPE
jgi:hypothetical protein